MKKFFLNLMMLSAIVVGLTLVSCDSDDNGNGATEANELSGSITGTKTLDASIEYFLTGPVIVEDGAVLDIPAGTVIKSREGFSKYILVLQGGKINVRGTAEKPVKMIADKDNAGQGYWGGLVINGKAPITVVLNKDGKQVLGSTEINSAYVYGGNKTDDNSGEISYLVLGNTGARSSADVEHNGLTLNGVGSGTKISNLYIYDGADDAIEFFGGSVNVSNLLAVNSDDDMFDFTQGYSGTLTNAYGVWGKGYSSSESDPRGIEADGNFDGLHPSNSPQADFKVINMTIELKLDPDPAAATGGGTAPFVYMHDVIKVRRGAKATVENALVKGIGSAKDLIDLKDDKGNADPATKINLTSTLSGARIDGGKDINGTANEGNIVVGGSNKGCPTDIFGWTGYSF